MQVMGEQGHFLSLKAITSYVDKNVSLGNKIYMFFVLHNYYNINIIFFAFLGL